MLMCDIPHCLPRYFFQSLQSTDIKASQTVEAQENTGQAWELNTGLLEMDLPSLRGSRKPQCMWHTVVV